jgi:ribosomal protein S10
MTFVTHLTFQSGDRRALESVVTDIKALAETKGVQFKGPHSTPSKDITVPQQRRLHADDSRRFSPWEYTVFTRELEIHGYEEFARDVAGREYPNSIHLECELEQLQGPN